MSIFTELRGTSTNGLDAAQCLVSFFGHASQDRGVFVQVHFKSVPQILQFPSVVLCVGFRT